MAAVIYLVVILKRHRSHEYEYTFVCQSGAMDIETFRINYVLY